MSSSRDVRDATYGATNASVYIALGVALFTWIAYRGANSTLTFVADWHAALVIIVPVLLWAGCWFEPMPEDEHHPHGRHREVFFWSTLAALSLLCIQGFGAFCYAAVARTDISPEPATPSWLAAIAIIAHGYATVRAWRILEDPWRIDPITRLHLSHNPIAPTLIIMNASETAWHFAALTGRYYRMLTESREGYTVAFLLLAVASAIAALMLLSRLQALTAGLAAPANVHGDVTSVVMSHMSVNTHSKITVTTVGLGVYAAHIDLRWSDTWFNQQRSSMTVGGQEILPRSITWHRHRVNTEIDEIIKQIREKVPCIVDITIEYK